MIDKIVENVESALKKLEGSISEEDKIKSKKQSPSDSKNPYPSIRYPIPKDSSVKDEIEEETIEITKQESIPEPPKTNIEKKKRTVIKQEILTNVKEEDPEYQVNEEKTSHDSEISFIDIGREVRLVHIYGPPSGGKTTLALQSAIE
ncbi:MAG: hypothetical protein ACXABJ_08640, partial [Candidatus Heimdallarchaeaceae archaeon]